MADGDGTAKAQITRIAHRDLRHELDGITFHIDKLGDNRSAAHTILAALWTRQLQLSLLGRLPTDLTTHKN